MKPIRVMIVDDHEIVREGLQILLAEEVEFDVVGTAGDGVTALTLAEQLHPVSYTHLTLPTSDLV